MPTGSSRDRGRICWYVVNGIAKELSPFTVEAFLWKNQDGQPVQKARVVVFLCEQQRECGLQDSVDCSRNREDEKHETFDRN